MIATLTKGWGYLAPGCRDQLNWPLLKDIWTFNRGDLAAHFMVARQRGVSLIGPPPAALLPEVPWSAYVDAVMEDFQWIAEGDNITTSPFYGVLNICRLLQMHAQGPGTVASKQEGALWALTNLPEIHRPLIRQALACYRSDKTLPDARAATRRLGDQEWDAAGLLSFRDFAVLAVQKPSLFPVWEELR